MHHIDVRTFDLNLVRVLHVLLQEGSVTKTAKTLGLSQPAVSHAIHRMRGSLDDAIVGRWDGEWALTPGVRALKPGLERVFAELQRVMAMETEWDPRLSTRKFVVACPDLMAALVPELSRRLIEQAPGVTVEMQPIGRDLDERLASGAVDVSMGIVPAESPSRVIRRLGTLHWCILCRKGHPAVKKGKLSLDDWLAHPHVVVGTAEGSSVIGGALGAQGHRRRVAFVAPTFLSAPLALEGSDWFFATPRELVGILGRGMGLQAVEPPIALPKIPVAVAWHERMRSDLGHKWFRELCAEAAQVVLTADKVPRKKSSTPAESRPSGRRAVR